jgi:iron complex transport system substrate-binding protein
MTQEGGGGSSHSPAGAAPIGIAPAGATPSRIASAGATPVGIAQAGAAVERVASLNLCTDQLLVLLAPEKVAGLSPLARDPALSFVAAQAARLPTVRASAEAVLRLHPDLVLAARWGAQTVLSLLEAEGLAVLRLDLPVDFPGIAAETRRLAGRLGVPSRGEALVASMEARLAAIHHPASPPSVIAWEPRGYSAAPDSLMGAVIRAAGLRNVSNGARLGLEELLRHPPDRLIVPAETDYPSLATDLLDHPAVRDIPRRAVPSPLTICAGPFTAEAASMLAR